MKKIDYDNNLLAFYLTLPMIVFFLGYWFYHGADVHPTGFIQYDNVAYIAYARQYLDASHFHLQYSNPFNDAEYAPPYFQTQTLFFAFLLKAGVPPGFILFPFTLICAFICFRLLIAIYDYIFPNTSYRKWMLWLFAWGGGLLTLAGALAHFALHRTTSLANDLFLIDPDYGWWGLNFGRSLFFSCEAYYHALFLGCIFALLKRKWLTALILLFVLSLSHPFTGLELICIVCLWCVVEMIRNRKELPWWFAVGALAAFVFHIWYYLYYLNTFPDHLSVSTQYSVNWRLGWYRMLPAYCFTGALAIAALYHQKFKAFFAQRSNRIFACWFVGAFLLANHEVFMAPRQPIHFTRGYIWTSLFLLGLPALHRLNRWLDRRFGRWGLMALGILFLADNFLWISDNVLSKADQPYPTYVGTEQEKVLNILDAESTNTTLIVSGDETIAYLSTVYTKAYPWYSHPFTTPFVERKRAAQRAFFSNGIADSSWLHRDVNYVLRKTDTAAFKTLLKMPAQKIVRTNNYIIFMARP